jgi:NTE family protein
MPAHDISPISAFAPGGDVPVEGIGVCLSGGGYRAMLFHLGTLWRLAETGYLGTAQHQGRHGPLGTLTRISSVSGGSITSAVLGIAWNSLKVDEPGLLDRFRQRVVEPIQSFASQTTVSIGSGLVAIVFSSVNKRVVSVYRKRLFGDATLQDLPDHPRFVINATNLQSGVLWRFSKPYTRDWRVGEIRNPKDQIAEVVGASSAFPPFLSPARFKYDESLYTPGSGADLQRPPFTTRPALSDGGVYDNLGLETVYKRYRTVIVSDAGGSAEAKEKVPGDWARQSFRLLNTIDNQVRNLRKRTLLEALTTNERFGAFFSIRSDISSYPAQNKLDCPFAKTQQLAAVATDLAAKDQLTQRRLINWGYAICDAGLRSWVDDTLPAPLDFPFAAEKV